MNHPLMRLVLASALALAVLVSGAAAALADQTDPRLDDLFARLKSDNLTWHDARTVESRIWLIWQKAESDEARTLMRAGLGAMRSGRLQRAQKIFTALVDAAPGFSEAWNKRATVYFMMGDFARSLADVRRTLALEPRHFGAISGLGQIYEALQDMEGAGMAYRKALEINPHMMGIRSRLQQIDTTTPELRI